MERRPPALADLTRFPPGPPGTAPADRPWSTTQALTAARRFPWKLFFALVVVAVSGAAGATFGVVQWLGHDLPTPGQLALIQAPVKTTVYDARGRILHEFFKENRSL